jgi:hypothetical protein
MIFASGRLLHLEHDLELLRNRLELLELKWEQERVGLVDLKEQIYHMAQRVAQRERRALAPCPGDADPKVEPNTNSQNLDPVTLRVLKRRSARAVPA